MSKKNKQSLAQIRESGASQLHIAEYKIIKHDLIKVLVMNFVYLAGVLLLYFTNAKTHYLERWFEKLLHF